MSSKPKQTTTESKTKEEKAVKHANIYEAMSALQGEIKPMKKNGHVKYQTSKGELEFYYTTLDEIMANLYPLLKKHGLSIRHEVVGEKEKAVEAILTHETYRRELHWVESERTWDAQTEKSKEPYLLEENILRSGQVKINVNGDMKEIGAAITYARRYTLTMALGIASEEDKDAAINEASAKNAKKFAYSRAETGIKNAKTVADLEKATNLLKDDMKNLADGKAPQLGLSKDEYEELMMVAEVRHKELSEDNESQ